MRFVVTYNGITDESIGCHAQRRPSVPAPSRTVTVTDIRGRDGAYYDSDRTFNDVVIPIDFSFKAEARDRWHQRYRAIKQWLLSGDNGDLKFSDDAGYHYRVRNVAIRNTERSAFTIGVVQAEFVCEGYTYLDSGDNQISFASSIYNDHDICHPEYQISGNGTCTLTVNGKSFVATVNGTCLIDTDRMITSVNGAWANTTATGDYEGLYLNPGSNTLSKTNGFTVLITPHWRCI